MAQKPQILASALLAYTDLGRAAAAMPQQVIAAILISLGYGAADMMFGIGLTPEDKLSAEAIFISCAIGLVWSFFLTPVYLAIHRFILLDEVTQRYTLAPGEPRFRAFFGWSVLLFAFSLLVVIVPFAFGESAFGLLALFALLIAFLIVSVRLVILFPAIAVDAPGANWRRAFTDSRGHFWTIFSILAVVMMPVLALGALLAYPLDDSLRLQTVLWSIASIACTALGVAAASRLFQRFAVWLAHPVRGPLAPR